MFKKACENIRESIYLIDGSRTVRRGADKYETSDSCGTAFLVSPGYLVSVAHVTHKNNSRKEPQNTKFQIIRGPELGNPMEIATLVAKHPTDDISIFKIKEKENQKPIKFNLSEIRRGESCGILGFPLTSVTYSNEQKTLGAIERFQGGHISGFNDGIYELDIPTYGGSSGCPCFGVDGGVIGMQFATLHMKNDKGEKGEHLSISAVIPAERIISFLKEQKIPYN